MPPVWMRAHDDAAGYALPLPALGAIRGANGCLAQFRIDQHPRIDGIMRDALETAGCVADCGHGTEVNGK